MICLDAPAEVLYARKREGTLELLESRRQEYLQARSLVTHFTVVDASQDLDSVERQVVDVISHFKSTRTVKPVGAAGGTGSADSNDESARLSKQPARRVTSP